MFNRLLEQETITYERCVRTPSRQVWKPLPTSSPTHLRLNSMPLFPLDNLGFSGVQIVVVAVACNSRWVLPPSHPPFSHSSPENYPLWPRQSPLRHTSPARLCSSRRGISLAQTISASFSSPHPPLPSNCPVPQRCHYLHGDGPQDDGKEEDMGNSQWTAPSALPCSCGNAVALATTSH